MNEPEDRIDWSVTTWEGSRREQIRRWRQLTVRERLEALDEMTDFAERLGGLTREAGDKNQS